MVATFSICSTCAEKKYGVKYQRLLLALSGFLHFQQALCAVCKKDTRCVILEKDPAELTPVTSTALDEKKLHDIVNGSLAEDGSCKVDERFHKNIHKVVHKFGEFLLERLPPESAAKLVNSLAARVGDILEDQQNDVVVCVLWKLLAELSESLCLDAAQDVPGSEPDTSGSKYVM
jgi:hypothetical protein